MRPVLFLFFAVVAIPVPGHAKTIQVPGDYNTIQEAIDAAIKGDTVLVHSGTFVENIDFKGKAVTVTSEKGAEYTVIDGNQAGSVVRFNQNETLDSVLEGFTITNGGITNGAGIHCESSGPKLAANIITKNKGWYGAGIYCSDASPLIQGNIVSENKVVGSYMGGGIFCLHSNARIIGNAITDNSAEDPTSDGGGICCFLSSDWILNNTISGNSAYMLGGGLCYFGDGSGQPIIANNVFCANRADYEGGGIYLSGDFSPLIVNCTLVDNWAKSRGGGFCCVGSKYPVMKNDLLWENESPNGAPEMYVGVRANPSHVTISYSLVQGGQSKIHVNGSTLVWGPGMIDGEPLFENPAGEDFHLTRFSPCINRGTAEDAPSIDFEGDPRPCMGTVDMGADEFTGMHPLEADGFELSEAKGGKICFSLDAGFSNNGRTYLILGSMTGTVPGFPLPGGEAAMPLNWDYFTTVVLGLLNTSIFQNFTGALSKSGTTYAFFDTLGPLPPGTAGLTLHFAYALNAPWDVVSNPVGIEIMP